MKLYEAELKKLVDKAGLYPFYIDEEGVGHVYLMIPSDPTFGGPHVQMPKGGVDEGETAEQAAIRETVEEAGLIPSNIKEMDLLHTETITGQGGYHDFTVYICTVHDPDNFDQHGWEAKWSGWVDLDEAEKTCRNYQRKYIKMIKDNYMPKNVTESVVINEDEEKIKAYKDYATKLEFKLQDVEDALEANKNSGGKKDDNANYPQMFKQRNKLLAQIAHALSQIDLITKHDVMPEPVPDWDPRQGTHLEAIDKWEEAIKPMVERIKHDCQPYLKAIESNVMEYRLYRGMKGADGPVVTGRVRLDDRKPQATGTGMHMAANDYFMSKFGEPFRDSMFTSPDADFAADYGNLFLVFPTGKFTFIWSPLVDDLYNHESGMDDAMYKDMSVNNDDYVAGHFGDYMDNLRYQNTDFTKAMESRQEIMIRTPVYYGINLSDFWQRNDWDDDSKGRMEGINKAMRVIQGLIK